MTTVLAGPRGEIALPAEMQKRIGIIPNAAVRIIESGRGVFLIPLTGEPPDAELEHELREWQSLAGGSWDEFPYEEK